jgi:uncharacterized membrane protein YkvA (DUF1232 family)
MPEQSPAAECAPRQAARERRERAKHYLIEGVRLLPNLAKLIGRLVVHPQVPAREKAMLAATIAYLASPIDIIPDFIPGLGEVDDIFIVALVLQRLVNAAGEELVLQNWDGDPKLLSIIRQILEASTYFLPKRVREKLVGRVNG